MSTGPGTLTAGPASPPAAPPSPLPALVAAAAGLLGVLVLALVLGGGRPATPPPALAQAGPLVAWGLPVATLAGRVAAVGTVGSLLFAAVLLPGAGGRLPAASRRAVRAASPWALAWAACAAAAALLTVADVLGTAPTAVPAAAVGVFLTDLPAGRAAAVVLGAAGLVAVLARRCTGALPAGLLLAVAVCGLVVPAVLTGHSAAAADHVPAVATLAVHVVAAAAWVGGLLALLLHGRSVPDQVAAAGRFSTVALACSLATGASGLLAAWLVLGRSAAPGAVLGSGYGVLLLAKTAALVALGVLGRAHRRHTLPRLRSGRPGAFRRFAAVEVAVMLATVAVAVALAASPPPAAGAAPVPAAGPPPAASAPAAGMAGHDHGELSVTVLVDPARFHVGAPVAAGAQVSVHNPTDTGVTLTADDGSFDVVVPAGSLLTFPAPDRPGSYPFTSRHAAGFGDVLVVR
ncbi:putative copper resistance protein D [Geodermatophilus pulveris]|uniref:Putative copper resistance protein D n=1 Tax=Geodermatophilus pulveris TaxID=1564159 RepID=A0A239BUH4_9ACTN|nr:CopD family protein [Geodermatophilus pulveris]SNS11282.1 putative copper resistance protein D [Geodermatophilus pulveris]